MLFAVDATDKKTRPRRDPRHMSKKLQRSDNLDLSQHLLCVSVIGLTGPGIDFVFG
jgi:hypothetical protein